MANKKETLFEAYGKRLQLADKLHARTHGGQHMNESKKLLVAKCLESTSKYIKEAYEMSGGTDNSNMGLFSKFSLNLINVALPTLIAPDIVLTHPMSDRSGYINYIEFVAGSNKGNTAQGRVFNDPFRLGDVDTNYTSSRVVKDYNCTEATEVFTMNWKPVIEGSVTITADGTKYVDNGEGGLVEVPEGGSVARMSKMVQTVDDTFGYDMDTRFEGCETKITTIVTKDDGSTVTETVGEINYETGTITFTNGGVTGDVNVAYVYDNAVIPQNDLPILNANMKMMPLLAKPRRIAIYYSQMAAFQAKNDYGLDLGEQLADKAVGQLSYEIDTEVTSLLINNAALEEDLVWSKTCPLGVSKTDHYIGFIECVEEAKRHIYDRTKRYQPNYMLISSSLLPILCFIPAWKAANTGSVNGPYYAGDINGLRVYVTPNIGVGEYVVGVNADDFMCSAAVKLSMRH